MIKVTKEQKEFMAMVRSSYLLNMIEKDYETSPEDAYTWLIQSKTYKMIWDFESMFYSATIKVLDSFMRSEYDGRMADWDVMLASY
jgi:hypothetical protein